MYTGGDDIIRLVSAIQPVFYSPDYEGYCIRENEFNNEREQIYRANTLIIHCVRKNGEKASYLASLIDPAAHAAHRPMQRELCRPAGKNDARGSAEDAPDEGGDCA